MSRPTFLKIIDEAMENGDTFTLDPSSGSGFWTIGRYDETWVETWWHSPIDDKGDTRITGPNWQLWTDLRPFTIEVS